MDAFCQEMVRAASENLNQERKSPNARSGANFTQDMAICAMRVI